MKFKTTFSDLIIPNLLDPAEKTFGRLSLTSRIRYKQSHQHNQRAEQARQQSEERYNQILGEAEEITHQGHVLMASTKFKRLITRAVIVPLVLMAVLAGVLLWQVKHLLDTAQWVDHTDQVLAQANNIRTLLIQKPYNVEGLGRAVREVLDSDQS